MTERQLRRLINTEIKSVLNEGIGDIKRAQRAANKNFVDPLIAKSVDREVIKLINGLELQAEKSMAKYGYHSVVSEYNKMAKLISNGIKKYGLTDEIMEEIKDTLEFRWEPSGSENFELKWTEDIYSSNEGPIVELFESTGFVVAGFIDYGDPEFKFNLDPFESSRDTISEILKDILVVEGKLSKYIDENYDEYPGFYESLSPEEKLKAIRRYFKSLTIGVDETISELINELKSIKPNLIKLVKMYK